MDPIKIIKHVDNSIIERLGDGTCFEDVFDYLKQNAIRFKKRDGYVQVSENYLVKNWNHINWKKRMTTMLVIQTCRRMDDIKWIIANKDKFTNYDNVKTYKLILLRDKLLLNYELPG